MRKRLSQSSGPCRLSNERSNGRRTLRIYKLENGMQLKSSQQEDVIAVSFPAAKRPPKFRGLWRLALAHQQIDPFSRTYKYCHCKNLSDFAQNVLLYKHKLNNFYTNILQKCKITLQVKGNFFNKMDWYLFLLHFVF